MRDELVFFPKAPGSDKQHYSFTGLGLKIEAMYDAGCSSELQSAIQDTMDYLESCSTSEALFPTMWVPGEGRIVFYYTPIEYLLVINKCRHQGDWIVEPLRLLISKGAKIFTNSFPVPSMFEHVKHIESTYRLELQIFDRHTYTYSLNLEHTR